MRLAFLPCAALLATAYPLLAAPYSFPDAARILQANCAGCHQGKSPSGGFNVAALLSEKSLHEHPVKWSRMMARVRESEMPPKGAPVLAAKDREALVAFIDTTLRTAACADGIAPGRAPLRRLNRAEYAATVRDLLNIHINAGHALPADGAGGEGFDNAAETLFLSPIHAEKYLEAARNALEYAATDTRSRGRFLTAQPGANLTPAEAARKVLTTFVTRAFRRPATPAEMDRYVALFESAQRRGDDYERALFYALQGVLISPRFLFRIEPPNPAAEPRLLDSYSLATRLSYFLWGTMPDEALFDLAAKDKLQDPDTLRAQVARLLKDAKSLEFSERFVEQWLNTRELGRDIKPDPKLFASYYDAEIQSAIRYEPVLFFQEVLASDLSLLQLIDSPFTVLTNKLARHYELRIAPDQKLSQQPKKLTCRWAATAGGLTSMAAVLAVSSLPTRTSPVLRGKWILEAMLGTPAPPPPPNVPPLQESDAAAPQTLRERLELHRKNPVCAACHNKIDPMGFGLENYDVLGRWRTQDAAKPIDSRGELPDGTSFDGPEELKQVLLSRKDLFLRNLTSKLLGYALGRGLTLEEYCTVDRIVEELGKRSYSAQTLITEIVLSVPFRYQEGTIANRSVADYHQKERKPKERGHEMTLRRKFPLSRRTLLRGAGAAIGLPWLEAMLPAAGNPAKPPVRLAALYMPNGVREDMWTPEGTGREFQLSPTLEPLADLKSEILVPTNLWNQGSKGGEGHYVKISGWLTSTTITKTLGVDINCNGISMDQVAAKAAARHTPLASLELGVAPVTTGVDKNVGYTRVYGSHIAWAGPTSPLAREINPRLVYERLFRASGPQGDTARQDIALLDRVLEDANQLRQSLGASDRVRMDEYLSIVRGLETRLERATTQKSEWKPRASFDGTPKPEGMPKDYADHVRLMLDMIALGFQTDTTRVATFIFGNEVSNQNFSFVPGVSGSHHSLSHHEKEADKLRQYQLINRWHMEQYAYLLRKLQSMKEGDSNVLHQSMVLIGGGIRDGNKHDPHNLPLVLGGRGGGRIATGQHLVYSPDSPLANLYVSMLEAFGAPVERFADSTGPAEGVLA